MRICILTRLHDLLDKNTGASVRICNIAENLVINGHKVHLVLPGSADISRLDNGIFIHEVECLFFRILEFLSRPLGVLSPSSLSFFDLSFALRTYPTILKSDVIQMEGPVEGSLMIYLLRKIFRKPIIVDSHDVFQAFRVKRPNVLRKPLEVFLERISYRYANIVLAVSNEEEEMLVKYGIRREKIRVVPNGVDIAKFAPEMNSNPATIGDSGKSYIVVFVGNLEYPPNLEAAELIIKKIAPQVQRSLEAVKFFIVGRLPRNSPLEGYGSADVSITGAVKDVTKVLAASHVAIAPLLHGSGTRLKILEYFSFGLPVVSTSTGVEGLEVEDGVNVVIEDNLDEFASRIVDLIRDRKLSMELGQNARELVVEKYDWGKITRKLEDVYSSLVNSRE